MHHVDSPTRIVLDDVAMNTVINTVFDIFREIGGPTKFAKAMGLKPSAASEMKRRNSIPVPYWPELIKVMKAEGKPLTYEQLVKAHQKQPERVS